jgi:hypothetical protein
VPPPITPGVTPSTAASPSTLLPPLPTAAAAWLLRCLCELPTEDAGGSSGGCIAATSWSGGVSCSTAGTSCSQPPPVAVAEL